MINFSPSSPFSEHVESAWINLSKQVIFDNKIYKNFASYYSNFASEVILFLGNLEQKDIVIYFELMTKSKINHFMKIIQNDQQNLNIKPLNCSFKAHFD